MFGILKLGSSGAEVIDLQKRLINKGYDVGTAGADGYFGSATFNALIKFQKDNGLTPDGVYGPITASVLSKSISPTPSNAPDNSILVKTFVNVALKEVGTKEKPINITPYGAWYGIQDSWCAIFVSWCAYKAGLLGNIVPKFSMCSNGVAWYKANKRYKTRSSYIPQSGDLIFFKSSLGFYYHTGIVNSVNNGMVYTIEGNTSDAVGTRSYLLTNSLIDGYGVNQV